MVVVKEELKFCENAKKKNRGEGVIRSGGGLVGRGLVWM